MSAPSWMSAKDVRTLDQAYYQRTRCSPQWRAFLAALIGELTEDADPAAVGNFLRHVGERLAGALPLPKFETLEELEAAMNQTWSGMDWGWVRLSAASDGVRILHGAYPDAVIAVGDTTWPNAFSAVLEGLYTCWFKAQGSPLDATRRASDSTDPLELFHGV